MSYSDVLKEQLEYNKLLTEYTMELRERSNKEKLAEFSEMRKFSMQTIEDADIFYIGTETEMIIPKYMDKLEYLGVISPTNKKPIYHNRYVIPIKDEDGLVMNLVGYSKEADERYVYGTSKYYRRADDMWGLERLHEAYEEGYAIVTEGITDAIALRNLGYRLAFARCGTRESEYAFNQLNRCRHGIIRVPDRDVAGKRALKKWTCNRYITLYTFIEYKDIDEMIKRADNGKEWVSSYMDDCIRWIKQAEHKGFDCEKVDLTMY